MGHMVNGVVAVDEGLGKCVMESGGGGVPLDVPVFKYRKRRISAVRDFPPGCGRILAPVNENPAAGDVTREECVSVKPAESLVAANASDSHGGLDQLESPHLSKSLIHEITMAAEESARVEAQEPMDTLESVTADMSSLQSPVESVLPEKPSEEASGQLQSPVTVDAVQRKVYTRRKVSACRDFPPGCGRNAAPVNLKALRKYVDSSKGRGLGREGSCDYDNVEQNVKADVKQGDKKVQADDSVKSEFEDRLQLKSEGVIKKQRTEPVHLKETTMKHPRDSESEGVVKKQRTEQVHLKETSVKHSRDSESPFTKTVDRVGGNSRGNSDMESVKLSKDMSFKRKFPGKSMNEVPSVSQSQGKPSVGSFDDREVVQSIMAKPNCPWGPGKKTLTPVSRNRLQVDQGKKTGNESKSEQCNESKSEQGKKTFKTPEGNGSQSEQGKNTIKSSTGSQSGALESHGDREVVLTLMAARNCPWRNGKKPVKSSGGQAKQR